MSEQYFTDEEVEEIISDCEAAINDVLRIDLGRGYQLGADAQEEILKAHGRCLQAITAEAKLLYESSQN